MSNFSTQAVMRHWRLVIIGLWACAASPSFAAETPLEVFAAHADFAEVRLSPTGEYVAAVVRDDERSSLVVIRIATMEVTTRQQLDIYNHIDDLWWASPRRLVASTSQQTDGGSQPRLTGELLAVDADGRNPRYLFGGGKRDRAFGWMIDPIVDDDRNVLVRADSYSAFYSGEFDRQSAYKLDVETGTRVIVATAPIKGSADFSADRSGRVLYVQVVESPGKRHLYWRENEQSTWRELPMPDDLLLSIERVEPDGSAIYRESRKHEPFKTCIVRRPAGSLQTGTVLGCSAKSWSLLYSADGRVPIAVRVVEEGAPRIDYLAGDHPDAQLLKVLYRDLAQDSLIYLGYTRDGSKLLIKAMSDRNAGQYYVYDRATNLARHVLSSRDRIDANAMSSMRRLALPASPDTQQGYLTLPIKGDKKPPLVVMLRGVYGVETGWGWGADEQALASRGYAVLDINSYSSRARSNEVPQPSLPDPAIATAESLTANLQWLRGQNLIDADRICVYGDSYGAYVALTAAVRHPELFRCVATQAGIVDIDAWRKDTSLADTDYGRQLIALYMSGVGRSTSSPLLQIEQLKAPLLLIHGRVDKIVPYSQSQLLMKALDRLDRPYEKYIENNEAHRFYKQEHRVKRYERLLGFFDAHIGRGTP